MVQIDFFDKNIIDTLVPVFSLKPSTLYFLYDPEKDKVKDMDDFRDAILYRLPDCRISFCPADSHDIDEIKGIMNELIAAHPGEEINVDITGGADLMIAAAADLYHEGKLIVYSLDLAKEHMFQVYDKSKTIPVKHLSAGDYLASSGAKYRYASHFMPDENEFDKIMKMAEEIFDHINVWKTLNHHIASYLASNDNDYFTLDRLKADKASVTEIRHLTKQFVKNGFLTTEDNEHYYFTKSKYKQYITTYGIWLEMYIYILAKKIYHEVYLGFVIDWRKNDEYETTDNELDVVVMHKSIPMLISCKMTKPQSKDITEIGYLAKRFGGDDCISCLATTYSLEGEKDIISSVYNRFENMHVGLIQVANNRREHSLYMFDRIFRGIPSKDE